MCLRFTGKTIVKNIEFSLSNGLEPATHENARMPISNRLRSKGIVERDRCAIGWSDIYDHNTNPIKRRVPKTTPHGPVQGTLFPRFGFLLAASSRRYSVAVTRRLGRRRSGALCGACVAGVKPLRKKGTCQLLRVTPGRDERDPPRPQIVSGDRRRGQTNPPSNGSACRRCCAPGSAPKGTSEYGGASSLSGAVVLRDRARRTGPAAIALSAHLSGWNGGTTASPRGRLRLGTSPNNGGGVAWADVRQLRNTIVNYKNIQTRHISDIFSWPNKTNYRCFAILDKKTVAKRCSRPCGEASLKSSKPNRLPDGQPHTCERSRKFKVHDRERRTQKMSATGSFSRFQKREGAHAEIAADKDTYLGTVF